jgi:L-methionine (R)-S-oxide reductase
MFTEPADPGSSRFLRRPITGTAPGPDPAIQGDSIMNNGAHDMDHALQHAIDKLCADSGTIHLRDADELVLHLVASHNVPESLIAAIRQIPWGKGMAGLAAQSCEPVDYCNLQTSTSPEVHAKAKTAGTQGAVVVPMMHGNEVMGTIGIGCRAERAFSASEIRWLMELGRQLASEPGDHRMAA